MGLTTPKRIYQTSLQRGKVDERKSRLNLMYPAGRQREGSERKTAKQGVGDKRDGRKRLVKKKNGGPGTREGLTVGKHRKAPSKGDTIKSAKNSEGQTRGRGTSRNMQVRPCKEPV